MKNSVKRFLKEYPTEIILVIEGLVMLMYALICYSILQKSGIFILIAITTAVLFLYRHSPTFSLIAVAIVGNLILWGIWVNMLGELFGFAFGLIMAICYFLKLLKGSLLPSSHHASSSSPIAFKIHARIPILRIPIPWISYELTSIDMTRYSWFGKDDSQSLKKIEDIDISGAGLRFITGVATISFESTKNHKDTIFYWKNIPAKYALILKKEVKSIIS